MNASASSALPVDRATDVTDHPLVHDVNAEHQENLSALERSCKTIAEWTGAPVALALAVLLQLVWIVVGIATRFDPFPFTFLLTCSNVLQLILIFILAVGAKQSTAHAELRAEHDHSSISRLLYHQEVQEQILLQIAGKIECDVGDIKAMMATLTEADAAV